MNNEYIRHLIQRASPLNIHLLFTALAPEIADDLGLDAFLESLGEVLHILDLQGEVVVQLVAVSYGLAVLAFCDILLRASIHALEDLLVWCVL